MSADRPDLVQLEPGPVPEVVGLLEDPLERARKALLEAGGEDGEWLT